MKSKTKISKQAERKTNSSLVGDILEMKKNSAWTEIAGVLTMPRRKNISMNLDKINQESKDGETILVPGKVLSQGEINKKIKIIAQKFSKSAEDKLSNSKIEYSHIKEEIKKNPSMKGLKILK